MHTYSDRETAQIAHALEYARHYAGAGAPGHSQFLLIAKLAEDLEHLKTNRINPTRLSQLIEENRALRSQ